MVEKHSTGGRVLDLQGFRPMVLRPRASEQIPRRIGKGLPEWEAKETQAFPFVVRPVENHLRSGECHAVKAAYAPYA